MWGVFNENGLIKSFPTRDEAEEHADNCNYIWQSCGFYVTEIEVK